MRVSDKFKEYIWMVDLIYRTGGISFSEIQRRWLETDMSGGVEISSSLFHRNKYAGVSYLNR